MSRSAGLGLLCLLVLPLGPALAQSSTTTTYAYDALGRVKAVTHQRQGTATKETVYTSDAADNRVRTQTGTPGSANVPPSSRRAPPSRARESRRTADGGRRPAVTATRRPLRVGVRRAT